MKFNCIPVFNVCYSCISYFGDRCIKLNFILIALLTGKCAKLKKILVYGKFVNFRKYQGAKIKKVIFDLIGSLNYSLSPTSCAQRLLYDVTYGLKDPQSCSVRHKNWKIFCPCSQIYTKAFRSERVNLVSKQDVEENVCIPVETIVLKSLKTALKFQWIRSPSRVISYLYFFLFFYICFK